jgi:RNA polymerase sigma-70 factor (ECF subfamily)
VHTWIHRIALNCCVDWAKRAHRRLTESREPLWWSQQNARGVAAGRIDATDDRLVRRDTTQVVKDALVKIHPNFSRTFELAEFGELSWGEIRRALNCSVGTVKSCLFRAWRCVRVLPQARGIAQ